MFKYGGLYTLRIREKKRSSNGKNDEYRTVVSLFVAFIVLAVTIMITCCVEISSCYAYFCIKQEVSKVYMSN